MTGPTGAPAGAPPHTETIAFIGCFDGRLVWFHTEFAESQGGAFPILLPGGGAALLTDRDWVTAAGAFVDAYKANPFTRFAILLHRGCWKIGELCKTHELDDWLGREVDPASAQDLYELAAIARERVRDELASECDADVPGDIYVYDVVFGEDGRPTAKLIVPPPVDPL